MLGVGSPQNLLGVLIVCCVVGLTTLGVAGPARADSGCKVAFNGCYVKAKKASTTTHRVVAEAGDKRRITVRWSGSRSSDFNQFKASAPSKPPTAREMCRRHGVDANKCAVGFLLGTPEPPRDTVTYITISPQQAALMAVAYLPLEPGKPTIGPPPELNKWKMAAVGYPLWVWADGDLDPAPVSQTVSGLSVSLDASLAKIVYDMGDGTKITCGAGTPWHKGKVRPGTPSPDCGHTYSKPSLPRGSYTISATTYWSVAWTAGGQSGTIPFTQTSTTTLPVGEVQTLVR